METKLAVLEIVNVGNIKKTERHLIRCGDDIILGFKRICELKCKNAILEIFESNETIEIMHLKKALYKKTIDILDSYLIKNLSIDEAIKRTEHILKSFLYQGDLYEKDPYIIKPLSLDLFNYLGEKYGLKKEEILELYATLIFEC
jgi:hypothetical protein